MLYMSTEYAVSIAMLPSHGQQVDIKQTVVASTQLNQYEPVWVDDRKVKLHSPRDIGQVMKSILHTVFEVSELQRRESSNPNRFRVAIGWPGGFNPEELIRHTIKALGLSNSFSKLSPTAFFTELIKEGTLRNAQNSGIETAVPIVEMRSVHYAGTGNIMESPREERLQQWIKGNVDPSKERELLILKIRVLEGDTAALDKLKQYARELAEREANFLLSNFVRLKTIESEGKTRFLYVGPGDLRNSDPHAYVCVNFLSWFPELREEFRKEISKLLGISHFLTVKVPADPPDRPLESVAASYAQDSYLRVA